MLLEYSHSGSAQKTFRHAPVLDTRLKSCILSPKNQIILKGGNLRKASIIQSHAVLSGNSLVFCSAILFVASTLYIVHKFLSTHKSLKGTLRAGLRKVKKEYGMTLTSGNSPRY